MPTSPAIRAVHTVAAALDTAATVWAIIVAVSSLLLAWHLRHSGVAIWAPTLTIGVSTAALGYTAASLAAQTARLRANNTPG